MASAGHPKLGPGDYLMVGGGGGGGGFGGGRLGSVNNSLGAIGNAGRAYVNYVNANSAYKATMKAGGGNQGGQLVQSQSANAKLANDFLNSPKGSDFKNYFDSKYTRNIPEAQRRADQNVGRSDAKANMEAFNTELRLQDANNQMARQTAINDNQNWLAKQRVNDLADTAKKAAGEAGKSLAKDAAAVGSATAASALAASEALAKELIESDDQSFYKGDDTCPGCRDKRPDRKRKRNKDYPPKDKDEEEEEEDEEDKDEKEEDQDESDDSGSSCEDGYEGESQPDPDMGDAGISPQ